MRTAIKKFILASLLLSTALLATGSVYAAPLYFPHVDTSLPWQTEIAIINTSNQTVTGTLRALGDEGQLIDTKAVTLSAHGRRQIAVAAEFANHTDIGYIIFDTNSNAVQGYTKFYQAGIYRTAIPAVKDINTSDIYISHIDSGALWWTGVSLVNTTSARKDLTITFNTGQSVLYTLNANEHRAFTIGSLFFQSIQPDIRSAVITNASGVIGLELFGNISGSNHLDGILLTNKTASTIYYPHVAGDGWWTGIAAYNPSASASTITVTPYSAQGTLLATSTLSVAGKGKYIGLVSGLGLPAQTAWFRIDSTLPLSGFELFGTTDDNQLAAYAGGGTGAKSGVFAKIEKNGWTGIAFVNTEASAASVSLTAYNDNGTAAATQALQVGGHAKVVNLAEAIFSQNISSATYIAYSSDRNVVGFQLNGSTDGMMLDGLPGLDAEDGGGGGTSSVITGGTFGIGNFVVTVAGNSIPPNANAAPVATAASAVPADIKVSSYETNVTSGAKAYTLKIGSVGFSTSTVGNVKLEVPFDRSLVPDQTKIDSLHILLRILNAEDNSVVDLTGQIVGNKIVADLTGFPSSATVVVLFNPNMDLAVTGFTAESTARTIQLSSVTWVTRNWAVVYDAVEVASEVKKFLGLSVDPTADQIRTVVKQQVEASAADAASIYQGEGFRSPTLYVAKTAAEAGGDFFGTNPRYLLYFQAQKGPKFNPEDPSELLDPDRNHYGRLYIQNTNLNIKYATVGCSIYGIIAHELFHAVQAAYNFSGKTELQGVREGTAAAFGDFLDRRHNGDSTATPQVRQVSRYPGQIKDETFKLENYLLIIGSDAYSNQDFFVYLARTIGNNDYNFLANVFEQLRLTIEDGAAQQANPTSKANYLADPPRSTVLQAVDTALNSVHGTSLSAAYDEFARQRAMEHNQAGRFGRPDETISGLAIEMFNNYSVKSIAEVQVNPKSTTPTTVSSLAPLGTLSSCAIRIRPSAAATGGDLTITTTPSKGAFGTTLRGWIYRNGVPTALNAIHSVSAFGAAASDEIVILLINPTLDQEAVGVTCEIEGAGGTSAALSGTYPSITMAVIISDPNQPPISTVTGSGSWSITGAGIELIKKEELRDSNGMLVGYDVVIYAPYGSQGTLTLTNNAVWSSAPKEYRDMAQRRHVLSYHTLELQGLYGGYFLRNGGVAYSISVNGSTVTIDYVMPKNGSNSFQITPQFGAYYDEDIYNKDGAFVSSQKNTIMLTNFIHVYVSTNKTY